PADRLPVPRQLLDVESDGEAVNPMVRGKAAGELDVLDGESPRLVEPRSGCKPGKRGLVGVYHQVGVAQLFRHLEPPLRPARGLVELEVLERRGAACRERIRGELGVAELLRELGGLARRLQ